MIERVALIGAGRAGASLAAALCHAGCAVTRILDVNSQAAERAAAACGAQAGSDLSLLTGGDWSLLFLTVPDDALAGLAERLAALPAWPEDAVVSHCSGALPAAVLAPLAGRAALASMHPLQSFGGGPEAWRDWRGLSIALEGQEPALARLETIVALLASRFFRITAAQKPLYHAAATLLANGLVALGDAALQLLAGLPLPEADARAMAAPLLRTTLDHLLADGPAAALTGPVVRGDTGTVAGHLRALHANAPELTGMYCALSLHLVHLAEQAGRLPLLHKEQMIRLLTENRE